MKVLDLFSGIGGFALGLQRAGFTTQYFCEIDPYCRQVLAKHWPTVPCFEDVRTLHGADLGPIDLICGGFPCQDISTAGKGAGLSGARSGLWSEYARLIGEVRPKYVLIENVAALRSRGLDQVLREIAALGYDAEWHCIPACAVGAPHRRDRVWIVAYPNCGGCSSQQYPRGSAEENSRGQGYFEQSSPMLNALADPHRGRFQQRVPKANRRPSLVSRVNDAELMMWPTPTARDHKDTGANTNYEALAKKSRLAGTVGGQLNPQWVSWLMGYPVDWCDLTGELPPKSRTESTNSEG